MRKNILIVTLLTVAIMLLLAVPAFANTGTKSGGYWPYSEPINSFVDLQGHAVASPSMIGPDSPHQNYTNTTAKCKVCHAVHGAGTINAAGTNVTSELLLRTTEASACEFCHLTNALAFDPYGSPIGRNTTPLQNYHSNGGGWVAGVTGSAANYFQQVGGPTATQYTVAASGHNAIHSHAIGNGYAGCASCHAVHGANTITGLPYILKNDPAKGVTSLDGTPTGTKGLPIVTKTWNSGDAAFPGYGSVARPVTSEVQFCQDCHDGTQAVMANGTAVPIVTQAQFETYFPSCGGSKLPIGSGREEGAGCHDSVSADVATNYTQFGVTFNQGHNGRSHVMTTALGTTEFPLIANQATTNPTNGCQSCHSVPFPDTSVGAPLTQNTFPHFSSGNELIPTMTSLTAIDSVCLNCHSFGAGTMGVGKTY